MGCIFRLIVLVALLAVAYGQTAQEQLASAHQLLEMGNNDAAIAKLNDMAARYPTVKGINHELGVGYYRKAEYLNAIGHLKRALQENANDQDAIQLLGLAYYLAGRPADAIPYLEKLDRNRAGQNRDAAFVLGLCYIIAREYDKALATFSQLYGLPAGSASSRVVFARILLLQGFDPVAEEQAQAALKEAPRIPLAHFILGQVYLYRSDLPRAIGELTAELALNPGYSPALTRLGNAYILAGRLDEAQSVLQRSIWLDADSAESYVLLGKVQLRRGQFAVAARNLERAIATDPNNYIAHHLLGEAYEKMGQIEAAKREMRIAAQIQQTQTTRPTR